MAETTQFVSRISVKDLISAFENRSETVRVEFSRPRARSYGNVLNKNVVVRLNEFLTLDDIENALTKLQTDLNFYEVYNKAKHVAFQEQSFNILTSIVNIENDEENSPSRKKNLISRTQTLVSFLNQKLPTNINQVIGSNEASKYKYVPYSSNVKTSAKVEARPDPVESKQNNETDVKPTLFVESSGAIDITQSGEEYFVSVKKLKENFQQKGEVQSNGTTQLEETVKNTDKSSPTTPKVKIVEPNVQEKHGQQEIKVAERKKIEDKAEAVSVTKLRSLFENGLVENSKGLEIITVDKPQVIHNPLGRSVQNINVPYTDRNLGSYRLQRSVSGNYLNYSGLLKRVDVPRSSSLLELSKDTAAFDDISDEESSTESDDDTVEIRRDPVKIETVEENYSSEPIDDKKLAQINSENFEADQVSIVSNNEGVQVKIVSKTEKEKNHIDLQETVPNGTATFVSENQPQENETDSEEEVSNLQGFEEEEVNFSKATTDDINLDEETVTGQELRFQGIDEVEVNTSTAQNVEVEENVAILEAGEEDVPQFTSTLEVSEIASVNDTTSENKLTFKGVDEIEVNSGTAESENVQVEEGVAKFEVTTEDDVLQSTFISGIGNQNIEQANDVNNSTFSSLEGTENHPTESRNPAISSQFSSLDLEDERDRSLIQEVIENIDVEKTLANADLIVNSEDLKNADDEFEKLMETSEPKK